MTPEILVRRGLDRGLLAMVVFSAVLHVGVVALLIIMPTRLLGPASKMESYTVDLVAPDVLGGTNLLAGGGKANAPASKPGPPAPVEPKSEPVAVQPAPPPPQEEPKAAEPPQAPPEPAKPAAEVKPVEPPKAVEAPKPVEPPKPVAPPKPIEEAVKVEPPAPAKPAEVKPPEVKPAEAKPVAPPKPAPVVEPKPAQPKPPPKAAEAPKPAAKPAEPPKPAAKPAPAVVAKPAEPPKKPEQAKPAPPANPVDDEIAAAVQRRATQVQNGSGGASRDLDKQIAAAVARRAQHAGAGAGAGASAAGGPVSIGSGSGAGGAPAGIDYILYQGKMEQKIKAAWAWAGADKSRLAVIQFNLEPDGQIKNVHTTQSSGDAQYDASCERAVRAVNPLEPVPERYRKEFATVELTFKPEEVGN
jgi:colicin import membrane protein